MTIATSILLVDDDRHLAESMAQWLTEQDHSVDTACTASEARKRLLENHYDLLITDLRLGDDDGFSLITFCKNRRPETSVLVITGYATPSTAIEAVRAGAFDLITKPLIDEELSLAIERAANQKLLSEENSRLRKQLETRFGLENIVSHDYRMLKIFNVIDSIADARAAVLITGENGTGKSMIARAIHNRSSRRTGPFVEVACGALPDALLESELFGHVAGAFTGAVGDRMGKFELANGGTLFLDEIGTASPAMQVKLLRVLQEFKFEPLGGSQTRSVDTRVILATNENLAAMVNAGRFRQDLYYRINVVGISLPALRERPGDVPLLVDYFLKEIVAAGGRQTQGFDREAMSVLERYSWPGNIRQLENVVERAVLLGSGSVLTVDDLPPEVCGNIDPFAHAPSMASSVTSFGMQSSYSSARSEADLPLDGSRLAESQVSARKKLRDAMEAPERQIILQTLRDHHWNRAATAEKLGINRTTLYKKMKRLGLDDPRLQFSN
jgi:DNA-binding NtrC family response regulator